MPCPVHRFAAAGALAAALSLAAVPTAAAGSWTFRGDLAWVDPDVDMREQVGDFSSSFVIDSAIGVAASAEYRFGDRFGVELGLLWAEPDVEARFEIPVIPLPPPFPPFPDEIVASGDVRFTPLTVGLNFHLTPDSRADLYIGPRAALAFYGDLELTVELFGTSSTESVDTDDEFGYGAGIGVDVPIGTGPWGFHAAADYLIVELTLSEGGGSDSLDFDPLIVRAGFTYAF